MTARISQPNLIAAILVEMATQVPGARISQAQFEVVRQAADSIVAAFRPSDEEATHV